jgi:hypothetical protein
MATTHGYPKYYKYKNPDPSTAKYAAIVANEILEIITKHINKRTWEIYHLKPDTVLGIDLKHAVVRKHSDQTNKLVIEIEKFEKENASDLRNYPWSEGNEKHGDEDEYSQQ